MNHAPKLQTVPQFSEDNPAFSEGGLRWWIFNEDKNGLKESGAIIRIGTGKRKKVLIDPERFFRWAYSQNQAA